MEKAVVTNIGGYVDRRLHPVRLSIVHLNKILEGSRPGTMLNVNRDLLNSIVSTLELFVEDFEANCLGREEKKTVEKVTDTTTPRITQTRVS